MNVLIKFNHGLGDAVQFTVVLKHLQKYRPDWVVDVRSLRGKHTAFRFFCRRSYHDQEPDLTGPYDRIFDLGWHENYNRYTDRPNSKITNCLAEVFKIPYDPELGRYSVAVTAEDIEEARGYLRSIGCTERDGRFNAVVLHYQGNTSTGKKDLTHEQARSVCASAIAAGRIPIILDWDNRSPLPNNAQIFCPKPGRGDMWGQFGSGDAARITALISVVDLFVGIDSGPGKCASATDTPTICVWTGHHPIQFHDPAPNTLHFVPADRQTPPSDCEEVRTYFERVYRWSPYSHLSQDLGRQVLQSLGADEHIDLMKGSIMLRSRKFDIDYYEEHKIAGLDYLGHGDWQEEYGKWIVESLALAGKAVIDVGCACGSIAFGIQKAGARIAGVDLNNAMIHMGRQRFPELALAVCDAINLHLLDDESQDLHHSNQVGEHWRPDHVPLILAEAYRVLKPGGILFCVTDTEDLFQRQGRQHEMEDPTNRCIKPLKWWQDQMTAAGIVPAPELERSLRDHSLSFFRRYDWDWVIGVKPAGASDAHL